MMKAVACISLLALGALADDSRRPYMQPCEAPCLTGDEVNRFVDGFKDILLSRSSDEEAAELVTEDFMSTSDSVNFVQQIPLNTTATRSRADLLNSTSSVPPFSDIKTLFVAHNCDTITWYFEIVRQLPTRGISIMFVDNQSKKIWKGYRESNIGATLSMTGNPECDKKNFKISVGHEGLEPGSSNCHSGACGQPGGYGGSS